MRSVALTAGLLAACGDPDALAQHEVRGEGDLLTVDGRLREPGWSSRQHQRWNPERVAEPARLRRWDFFSILGPEAAVNLTMSDLGSLQTVSVGVVDRGDRTVHAGGALETDPALLELSAAVIGRARYTPAGAPAPAMTFSTVEAPGDEVRTTIAFELPASLLGEAARGSFTVRRPAALPYLSLATPFREDVHDFFFEQKIHGMRAEGTVTVGQRTWTFDAADTGAVLDWGRGQWPAQVTWRWAGGADLARGISFNLGEGFGDDRAGTENLIVAGGVAHKLGRVAWTHDPADPLADWRFDSADGRVSLVLRPDTPEVNDLDLGDRFSHLRKAYGTYEGTLVLDDGTVLELQGVPGFAEEMNLAW